MLSCRRVKVSASRTEILVVISPIRVRQQDHYGKFLKLVGAKTVKIGAKSQMITEQLRTQEESLRASTCHLFHR